MATNQSNIFLCPNCKRKYQWRANLNGHKVKCSCGAKLHVTNRGGVIQVQLIDLVSEDDVNNSKPAIDKKSQAQEAQTYELNEDADDNPRHSIAPPQKPQKKIISSNEGLYELEIPEETDDKNSTSNIASDKQTPNNIAVNKSASPNSQSTALPSDAIGADPEDEKHPEEPAYVNSAVAAARREEDRKKWANQQAEAEHRKINVIWPLAMLIIGSLIILIAAFAIQEFSGKSGLLALAVVGGLEIIIMTPLLIFALFISASLLKLGFGDIQSALFKAVAINTGPGALADIISIPLVVLATVGFLSMMAGPFIVYLILIGIPLSKMFDLDFQETAVTIIIIIALRLAAFLLIFMNIYSLLFSAPK